MPSGYVKDLIDHKTRVAGYVQRVANDLSRRAAIHDNSKFSPEEYEAYEAAFPDLQKYAYGSDKFNAALEKIKPAIEHHYKANDHHPEFYEDGINDMTLPQVIEMVFDWIASSERSQTNFMSGLEINRKRFNIDGQTFKLIVNTLKWYAPEKLLVTDPLI